MKRNNRFVKEEDGSDKLTEKQYKINIKIEKGEETVGSWGACNH